MVKLTDKNKVDVVLQYASGQTIEEIASNLSLDIEAIRTFLAKNKVTQQSIEKRENSNLNLISQTVKVGSTTQRVITMTGAASQIFEENKPSAKKPTKLDSMIKKIK